MAKNNILEYCILNLAAQPHPKGIYERLLTSAADFEANYWGDRHARISPPKLAEDGFFRGRVATWNEIDFSQPGISKAALEEIDLTEVGSNFPPEVGVNGRIFNYIFRESDHTVFVETLNDSGQRLSPKQAGKVFQTVLEQGAKRDTDSYIEVTVIPDEEAVEQILSMARLRVLTIRIVRPNAEEIAGDALKILEEMEAEGTKTQEKVLRAAPGESIKPNKRTQLEIEVGQYNGYVSGEGSDADGEPKALSTQSHPRIIKRVMDELASSFASILAVAKSVVVRTSDR